MRVQVAVGRTTVMPQRKPWRLLEQRIWMTTTLLAVALADRKRTLELGLERCGDVGNVLGMCSMMVSSSKLGSTWYRLDSSSLDKHNILHMRTCIERWVEIVRGFVSSEREAIDITRRMKDRSLLVMLFRPVMKFTYLNLNYIFFVGHHNTIASHRAHGQGKWQSSIILVSCNTRTQRHLVGENLLFH